MTREALQEVVRVIGGAQATITSRLGDTDRNPAALLFMEAALCRLRGASLFFDDDYGTSLGLSLNVEDRVGFGLQSGKLAIADQTPFVFPVQPPDTNTPWTPAFYGPPSGEGWGIWRYNGWQAWQPDPLNDPLEDAGSVARLSYNYPVRFLGGSTFAQAPLWECARYLSILLPPRASLSNGGGASGTVRLTVSLPKIAISGCHVRDSVTRMPRDFAVGYMPFLIQTRDSNGNWLDASIGSAPIHAAIPLVTARLTAQGTDHYTLSIDVPADVLTNYDTYAAESAYWHVILYWRSYDPFAQSSNPTYGTVPTPVAVEKSGSVTSAVIWPRKNFFVTGSPSVQSWEMLGIEDNTSLSEPPYLVARDQTHFAFEDGGFSEPSSPNKYVLPAHWPDYTMGSNPSTGAATWTASNNGDLATFIGQSGMIGENALPIGCAVLGLLLAKTQGTSTVGTVSSEVVLGPVITPEFFPASGCWADSPYFPPVPQDYVIVGRFALKRAQSLQETETSVAIVGTGTLSPLPLSLGVAVVWFEQFPPTHARGPLGDANLARLMLSRLTASLTQLRTTTLTTFASDTAFQIVPSGVNFPSFLASNRQTLSGNPDGQASTVFRGLVKNPIADSLVTRPDGEPLAIPFDENGIALMDALSGETTSTELVRFDASNLYLTGNRLVRAQSLEIYQDTTDQCSRALLSGAGSKIGLDYTLRLILEDDNANTLDKTVFITASTYYLTQAQYDLRQSQGLSTSGYFWSGNLKNMEQWRLYGYAGVMPDFVMGAARPLLTRVVAPVDSTKMTEAQFVAQEQAQGISAAQIQQDIADYIDANGPFYVVDLNQYTSEWLAVREAIMGITTYTFSTVSYWTPSPTASGPNTICDGFTIAEGGLAAGALETDEGNLLYASFLRNDWTSSQLTVPNTQRTTGEVYIVDAYWNWTCRPLTTASSLYLYPRASGGSYCTWAANKTVVVRYYVQGQILTDTITITAGEAGTPILIGGGLPIESVAYVSVGELASDVSRPFYGAPDGDRLVVRSA